MLNQLNTMPLFKGPKVHDSFESSTEIVLHCGNSLDFLKTIPDETIKLIITSPPYNLGKEYENKIGIDMYLNLQDQIIDQLVRILRHDGSLCWQVGNFVENSEVFPLDVLYYSRFKKHNLKLRNRIIWRFNHGLHASKRFSGRYETILWFTKSDSYTFNLDSIRIPSKYPGKRHFKGPKKGLPSGNPLGKNPSDIWEFINKEWEGEIWDIPNVKANHPQKTIHPCQYPIELIERCVLSLSNQGDWVLDPYCGVGSTIIGAIKHDRKAAGVDKEQEYIKVATQRIEDFYTGKLKYRPIGKPVFVPTGKEKVSQIPPEWSENKVGEN